MFSFSSLSDNVPRFPEFLKSHSFDNMGLVFDCLVRKSPKLAQEMLDLRLESQIEPGDCFPGRNESLSDRERTSLKIDLSLFYKPPRPAPEVTAILPQRPFDEECCLRQSSKFSREPETLALIHLLTEDQRELMHHPVTEAFSRMKWRKLQGYFYFGLFYQCLFSVAVTVLSVVTVKEAKSWKYPREIRTVVKWTTVGLLVPILIKVMFDLLLRQGLARFFVKEWRYFTWDLRSCKSRKSNPITVCYPILSKGALARVLQIILLIGSVTYGSLDNSLKEKEHYHILAWAVVTSWMVTLSLMKECPHAGIYVLTLGRVVMDVIKFVLATLPIYLGFGFAFHALFGRLAGQKIFNNPWNSYFSVLAMAFGYFHFAHNRDEVYHRELMDSYPGK